MIPSLRYSCSASPLVFTKGKTASESMILGTRCGRKRFCSEEVRGLRSPVEDKRFSAGATADIADVAATDVAAVLHHPLQTAVDVGTEVAVERAGLGTLNYGGQAAETCLRMVEIKQLFRLTPKRRWVAR